MKDAQCAEQNENMIKIFSDFYFSGYREKFIENYGDDVTKNDQKMTITRKIKIRILIFFSIQLIPDLSCKFVQFKKNDFDVEAWLLLVCR